MEERLWHKHYDYSVLKEYRFPRYPVQELLGIPSNVLPDKAAINYYGATISFFELRQLSCRMANALSEIGVKKGDRVGLHLPNIPQYIISYYATLTLGAVVVNLNPLYTADEMVPLIRQTGVTTLVTFDMVVPVVKTVAPQTDIPRIIATSVFDYMDGTEMSTKESLQMNDDWFHFSQLVDNCLNLTQPKVEILAQDPAMIQFTGGTTGIPKGALLTHQNIVAGAFSAFHWGSAFTQYTPFEKKTVMCALPFFIYMPIFSA